VDRRRFLLTSLAGVLAAPLAAEPQQAGKLYRVGYLGNFPPYAEHSTRFVCLHGWLAGARLS
jgi:hypothetical protein